MEARNSSESQVRKNSVPQGRSDVPGMQTDTITECSTARLPLRGHEVRLVSHIILRSGEMQVSRPACTHTGALGLLSYSPNAHTDPRYPSHVYHHER